MKKSFVLAIGLIMMFTFFGCGDSTVTNEQAGNAVKAALEARWTYQKENEAEITAKNAGEEYIKDTEAELGPIAEYKEAEFEDPDMGTAVKEYISILEKQLELYGKYDGDYWTQEYNNLIYRQQRQQVIKNIIEKAGTEFTGESKENYDNLMDTAEYDNLKDDAEIVEEAFTIEDTKNEKDEWDYRTVQFKVKNNTGYTFPEYAIIYRVKSSDGTTIESEMYDYISNFEAGSTTWSDDIGYDLKKGYTIEAYGYIAGTEEGYINNQVELKEPVVIKIKD